jgi:hypothetical protein
MLYADRVTGERVRPFITGDRALCHDCKGLVIAKCGDINVHHWAHKSNKDCDPWSEPETYWHLSWKNSFPKENIEVTIMKDGKFHRADAVGNDGTIIEFQHSPISSSDIKERETFYENMIWIFDMSGRRDGFKKINEDIYAPAEFGSFAFKWSHYKTSIISSCIKPIYFDFTTKKILSVKMMMWNGCGIGTFIEKDELLYKYR